MPSPRNRERDREIGARICLARILGKSHRPALGKRIGVSYQQVAKYERGEVRVPASLLEDFGVAFGRDPAFFLATCPKAVAEAQLLDLPQEGSIARRHLDQALAVLQADGRSGGLAPFVSAAPVGRNGSEAA